MKALPLLAAALLPVAVIAAEPLWMRHARISPDGTTIAFTYKGDIWTVPSAGGRATRITSAPSIETSPVWSPDSRQIAFASDRHGNNDVFVIPATGGTPRRLTVNSAGEMPEAFTPDGSAVLFSADIQVPAQSAQFPASRLTQVYEVPVSGGPSRLSLGTTAQHICFLPDGSGRYLYQDQKGHENEWRKHHTSSITRDLWLYDPASGSHTRLTDHAGEDRDPVAVGSDLYFLSERGGAMNVYRAPLASPSQATAVTDFRQHPVRFLSAAKDGTLCFGWDGELYTLAPGGKPAKVKVEIVDDDVQDPYKITVGTPAEMAVAPDGKSVAFIYRGDVFVTSVDYKTTRQITATPQAERWVSWAPDSKSLVYTSERDGRYNIYRATLGREDDPNFPNATLIAEEALFKADKHERTVPKLSPDGKQLAFILDRNTLAVRDMESGKVRTITDGTTYRQRDAEFPYHWSPDSRWIVLESTNRDPYTDISIVNVSDGTLHNLTNSGYFDQQPRWVLGGDAILFLSERYGMRNHASWGSQDDVMIVFLNQEAYDRFSLNKEDAELLEQAEKENKDKKKDDSEPRQIVFEPEGIDRRTVRLSPFSMAMRDAYITSDGKTLYYISQTGKDNMLWEKDLREGDVKMSKTISSGLREIQVTPDGKNVFMLGSSMQKFTPSGAKLTPITFSAQMRVDPVGEREYMFDHIVREEQERFYDKKMHGVDWPRLTDHYRRFLPYINNNEDYTEMLSEMLGELNVSHTGGRSYGRSTAADDRTASLGLLFDLTHTGRGLKVAEVLKGGPLDNAVSQVVPGTLLVKINGQEITADTDWSSLLLDLAGRKTLVSFSYDGTDWDEVVKPVSRSAASDLLYERWVAARAAAVDSLSGGRLGYVHIKGMNDPSFRRVYSDLLGKYNDREGVVVDIRWNGGGRLHEDIEMLLSGEKYLTQEIRGERSCDMPSRRWNKPSVMIISEACYSNAHGTPWVYKHKGMGKLVGMPVPGTMTSVNWETLQDPSIYYGIPVIGYRTAEGNYLENTQLEPDVRVANTPETLMQGRDLQLEAAVKTLLDEIDGK